VRARPVDSADHVAAENGGWKGEMVMKMETVVVWVKGLLAAGISGAASAVTAMVVDPMAFNFEEGMTKLVKLALVSALVGIALYLKASPIPGETKAP